MKTRFVLLLSVIIVFFMKMVCLQASERGRMPEVFSSYFNYTSNAQLHVITQVKNTPNYQLISGMLRAQDDQHNGEYFIKFTFYRTLKSKVFAAPWVLQLPPLGSSGLLEEIVGNYLTERGYSSLVVIPDQNPTTVTRSIEDTDPFFIRNTVSVRQSIDYFSQFSFLDPRRIGSMGVSLGGLRSGYLIPTENRIKKGLIIMGSGNIPNVLAYSQEMGATAFRKAKMKEHGFRTPAEYRDALRRVHYLDPLDMAPYVETNRVAMIITSFDTMVPKKEQFVLWDHLGRPEHLILPSEHMTAAFFIFPILEFMHQQYRKSL